MEKKIVTAEELAVILEVKPATVLGWARKGLIPVLHLTPKTLRFDLQSVLNTVKESSGQKPSTPSFSLPRFLRGQP